MILDDFRRLDLVHFVPYIGVYHRVENKTKQKREIEMLTHTRR